jgi:hypothetical protein
MAANMLTQLRQLLAGNGRKKRNGGTSDDAQTQPSSPHEDGHARPDREPVEEGAWTTDWRRGKLRIHGTFRISECTTVVIRVAGEIEKQVSVAPPVEGLFSFSFAFGKSALVHFPSSAGISVEVGERVIPHESGQHFFTVEVPNGDGTLHRRLDEGYVIDKWGQLKLPIALKPEWSHNVLTLYQEFSAYFENHFGKRPFFIAGSLLGLIRENNFLPFDDDMDVGYFSTFRRPESVRDEMFEMLKLMIGDGLEVRIGHNGGFYKVGSPDADFDVFPSWHYKGRVWMPQSQSMPSDATLMHPPRPVDFLGTHVFVPNRPEDYLALHYGEDWRVPDPHYLERKQPGVLKVLRRVRLTIEQRQALAELQRK